MAYNEKLADRVREALADVPDVEENVPRCYFHGEWQNVCQCKRR
jgi:hypothetical protein